MRTQIKNISLVTSFLSSTAQINWQNKGTCGVPYTQPNADIFETIEERTTRNTNIWEQIGRSTNQDPHTIAKRITKASTRIIGGQTAKEHSWPWQVYIVTNGLFDGYYDKHIECGGVLIDPFYVLTAAHCIGDETTNANHRPSGRAYVGLHEIDIYGASADRNTGSTFDIIEFIRHPDWDSRTFANDIAILKLNSSAFAWNEESGEITSHGKIS